MAYNTDSSGSTLSAEEMSQEAKRILDRLDSCDLNGLTDAAKTFVMRKLEELDSYGTVSMSVKSLFWLRDISDKVD
jgi:hypothetical protein